MFDKELCKKFEGDNLIRCCLPDGSTAKSLEEAMLYGWFNDQVGCREVFFNLLEDDVLKHWSTAREALDRLKELYRKAWPTFRVVAKKDAGVHKRKGLLSFPSFRWWADSIFNASRGAGSLEFLISGVGTVEAAHEMFKPWFVSRGRTDKPRLLNAADAARILADAGYLQREQWPLLARGALRGAAIAVDSVWVSIDQAEALYPDEKSRRALEDRSAAWAKSLCGEEVRMDAVENWFCVEAHKVNR